jgi:hypothetical protein
MKQLTVDVLTSVLVLVNVFTGILDFLPAIIFVNPLLTLIPLPISPLILAVILMVAGVVLDVSTRRSRYGSLLVIAVFTLAYWTVTPNLIQLALFVGVIVFGQFALKE